MTSRQLISYGGFVALMTLTSSCGGTSTIEPAQVTSMTPALTPPPPNATALEMVAHANGCIEGESAIEESAVKETDERIVVTASVRTQDTDPCEVREASVPFQVQLDKPLGSRAIVDGSNGRVIWSTGIAAGYRRGAQLTPGDCEAFVHSVKSDVDFVRCTRANAQYFYSNIRTDGSIDETVVRVDRFGRLSIGP